MKTIIETSRLLVREYSTDDITPLHKILSKHLTMSFWPKPFTVIQTQSWLERSLKSYREIGFGLWALEIKLTGELIGTAGILISEVNGKQENDLGYIVHFPYWNKGYAAEAAEAILRWGLDTIGFRRIVANMLFDNTASIMVAEKIGMKKDSEFINKRNRDTLTYLYAVNKY